MAPADLSQRLLDSECGSLQLDADIYEMLGHEVIREGKRLPRRRCIAWRYRHDGYWRVMRQFTRSVDDALFLVDDKKTLRLDRSGHLWSCILGSPYDDCKHTYWAKTAALAICAAFIGEL